VALSGRPEASGSRCARREISGRDSAEADHNNTELQITRTTSQVAGLCPFTQAPQTLAGIAKYDDPLQPSTPISHPATTRAEPRHAFNADRRWRCVIREIDNGSPYPNTKMGFRLTNGKPYHNHRALGGAHAQEAVSSSYGIGS
jgi:hypothetical protein